MKLSPEMEAKCMALAGVKPATGTDPYAEVPLPPSTNNLFVTRGKRRVKSPAYRAWLAEAAPLLAKLKRVPPPYEIVATVYGAINHRRDLDNLMKPLGDSLVIAGVIPDDCVKHVRAWSVSVRWGSLGEAKVLVEVRTAEG